MAEIKYPLPVFHFLVKVGGEEVPFSEVSGLTMETQLIEYRNGSSPEYSSLKMSGIPKYSNITLKRGVTGDLTFWNWIRSGISGQVLRRDMSVTLLDESHQEVMRWKVRRAWPCKWSGPNLKAGESEVAIESLEIAHEGFEIDD